MLSKILFLTILISVTLSQQIYPVAIFHGAGQFCNDEQMSNLVAQLQQGLGDNIYVKCIEYGGGLKTINRSMETQSIEACQLLNEDPNLTGDISVVGLSQGAMISRYIIQKCKFEGQVKRYIGIGGPQMGGASCPKCFTGIQCVPVNALVRKYAYTDYAQNNIGPAGCFNNALNQKAYLEGNKFLPYLNNQVDFQKEYKEKIENLEVMQLVQFLADSAVNPPSSAWFNFFNQSMTKVIKMEELPIYKDNLIGLKTLHERNSIQFVELPGDHLEFNDQDIQEYFVPALQGLNIN